MTDTTTSSLEEKFRRAKALADDIFEIVSSPWSGRTVNNKQAEELASLLYDLGVDLDATGNYAITAAESAEITEGHRQLLQRRPGLSSR